VVHLILFPSANFCSLSCAPIYNSTTFWILKLKAFQIPPRTGIFPPANIFQPLGVRLVIIPPIPGSVADPHPRGSAWFWSSGSASGIRIPDADADSD
jgi:hypothetical protein